MPQQLLFIVVYGLQQRFRFERVRLLFVLLLAESAGAFFFCFGGFLLHVELRACYLRGVT